MVEWEEGKTGRGGKEEEERKDINEGGGEGLGLGVRCVAFPLVLLQLHWKH